MLKLTAHLTMRCSVALIFLVLFAGVMTYNSSQAHASSNYPICSQTYWTYVTSHTNSWAHGTYFAGVLARLDSHTNQYCGAFQGAANVFENPHSCVSGTFFADLYDGNGTFLSSGSSGLGCTGNSSFTFWAVTGVVSNHCSAYTINTFSSGVNSGEAFYC